MNQKEHLDTTMQFRGEDGPVSLRYTLLESGAFDVAEDITFRHPVPMFNRLFVFSRGGCHIHTWQREYELRAGAIHLLPQRMHFTTTYYRGSRLYFFHLHARTGLGMHLFQRSDGILTLNNADDLITEIVGHYDADDSLRVWRWQFALLQSLTRLCQPLLPQLAPTSTRAQKYYDLLKLIDEQCAPTLTVRALAQQLQIAPATLSKRFQRTFGMPLDTYITQLIMQRAADLLTTTDLPVKEIADMLGFADPAYFHRIFKQQMAQTPNTYRQEIRAARYLSE